ncbi:MAG: dipeptidase [Oscillospiraceae bacterium]|nr:dipeptidase [Oscillospiraceae bacterium]
MRLFDLHCDTVTTCIKNSQHLAKNTLHLDLERGARYEAWGQVFALFVPDTLQGEAAWQYYKQALQFYRQELAAAPNVHPVLAVENGTLLCGQPERVAELAADGVRILTLTWNGQNALGFGAACDPAPGLTPAGRESVRMCWRHGILPDVSHLNEAGVWEVDALCAAAKAAGQDARYIASHSCCAALHPHRRNLSDAQCRALFAAGGLLGLNLYPEFLGGAGDAADVARHLEHLLALGGAKHTALGSDFDGCTLHESLAGIEKMTALRDFLEADGCTPNPEDFFFVNACNFLGNML